jgi:hypothetical protein
MTRKWLRPVGDPERGLFVELRESFEYPYQEGKLSSQLAAREAACFPSPSTKWATLWKC